MPKWVQLAIEGISAGKSQELIATLQDFDFSPYVVHAGYTSTAVFGALLLHELAHQVVALSNGVKLDFPLFSPFAEIGSLGTITPFKSLLKNRAQQVDISLAGPLAGGIMGAILFGYGINASLIQDAPGLLPIPISFLNTSEVMQQIVRNTLQLDPTALMVNVDPMLLAGWAIMFTNALNLLPVGRLDGGRAVQSAYGEGVLNFLSVGTYASLVIFNVGGPVGIWWLAYILLLQRSPENSTVDAVTEPGYRRKLLTALMVSAAALLLIPGSTEVVTAVVQQLPEAAQDAPSSIGI